MATQSNEAFFRKKILGLLTDKEEKLFEAQFSEDPNFRERYLSYKEMMETVIVAEQNDLKQQLKHLNQPNKKRFSVWLPIAASFALLLGLAYFSTTHTKKDLFDTYFDTYPNVVLPTTRGSQGTQDILEKAFFNYDSGRFTEANKAFEIYLERQEDPRISFYRAMALMNVENFEEAQKILLSIAASENETFEYLPEVRWYLALLHLEKGNNPAAVSLLRLNKAKGVRFKAKETDELLIALKDKED